MRYLCIDLGDRRTGVAVGDTVLRLASPVTVIEIPVEQRDGDALLDEIARICREQLGSTGEIVLGLPLNMDGTEGPRAKAARAFAGRIEQRTTRAVRFMDERLSSVAADWTTSQSGLTHKQKKQRRDALAAASILQGFLNALTNPEP